MKMKRGISYLMLAVLSLAGGAGSIMGQETGTVPPGIHYQAVARDAGGEIKNQSIDVRFTILAGETTVYEELHHTTTTQYGVFSLVIGNGEELTGTFEEIDWSTGNHSLQVDVDLGNGWKRMGTISFFSVPYALYAGKSLEPGPPGPAGPKGDPGDPASDDQELSYNRSEKILSIDNGNSVRLDTIIAFRARNLISDIAPQISNITMTYDEPDMSIGGGFNAVTGVFTAPADGIYTFNVSYFADGAGSGRELSIYVNSAPYEKLAIDISSGTTVTVRSVTIKLSRGNTVSVNVYTGTATQTGTGTFAGYKVN